MGAVYNRYTITAAGKYLLAPAGAGMGAGGWQVSVSGTFVASGTLKQATSAPGSTLTLGSAITYYDVTTLASSTAAITAAASVVVPDTGSDLYLDVTSYTSGAVVVLVSAAGEEIGSTEGNLTAFDPTFFGTLASAAGTILLGTNPYAELKAVAASGERLAGGAFGTANTGAAWVNAGTTANLVQGILYYNGTSYYSAAQVANTAAGFGTLALMKSGGTVVIGTDPGGAQLLRVGGAVFIKSVASGVVSLGLDGNSPNGTYLGFSTGGGAIGDIGTAVNVFGSGSGTDLAVGGRSGKQLVLGAGGAAVITIASTGITTSNNALLSSSATGGVGYATGAGGAQTQSSNKATTVVLNTVCGTITMNNAALNANTTVSFTLTNSAITATDVVVVVHDSVGTLGAYTFAVTPAAGSASIAVRNITAGSLSEAIVLRFVVIKAVVA